ncbi:RHS repeat domain-containing protein [Tundrisphaera lichenicola]|uniref:RHS repeat domain-containing protein n=1 Tax=Tundrisphaera lichenicola TaxID=2029860 RepID=UPI003EBF11F0
MGGGFEDRLFALFEDSSHSDICLFIFPTEPILESFRPLILEEILSIAIERSATNGRLRGQTKVDADGNLATVKDPLGHTTTSAYDARDRLASQTRPSGGGTTTYTYDLAGNLATVKDPVNNVTSYGYDAANRQTTETDPRGKVTTYAYDLSGNLTKVTDRLGRITSYAYDADDRETVEQWIPVGGGTATYTMTLTYDAAGRQTQVQDNSSKYAYGYDNANRLITINDQGTTGLPQVTLTYGVDNVGNRTSLADTKGGVVTYTYNARDQLTTLTQSGTGVSAERVDLAYDAALRMTTLTRYSDTAGTTAVMASVYAYDAADRLTTLTHQTPGGTAVIRYGYTLDAADRLTFESRIWDTTSTESLTYGYTDDDQLTSVVRASGPTASFGYDANGNRNMSGYSTGTGNRTSSDGTNNYAYDDEGNLTSKTVIASGNQTLYKWDYRNRLIEVDSKVGATTTTLALYTYDALNRPIKVVEGGATRYTLYEGQTPLLDFDGSGATTARYLSDPRAIDAMLARQTSSGVAWYLDDRLGTVRDIVNNSGTVIDHLDYAVYGKVSSETAPASGDRFKYAGMELDSVTGLYYDRARYYDAVMGRFLGEDPLGFSAWEENMYRFVFNDPLGFNDLTGFQGEAVARGSRFGAPAMPFDPANPALDPTNYWNKVSGDLNKLMNRYNKTLHEEGAFILYNPCTGHYAVTVNGRQQKQNRKQVGTNHNPTQISLDYEWSNQPGDYNTPSNLLLEPIGPPDPRKSSDNKSCWFVIAVFHTHPHGNTMPSVNPKKPGTKDDLGPIFGSRLPIIVWPQGGKPIFGHPTKTLPGYDFRYF